MNLHNPSMFSDSSVPNSQGFVGAFWIIPFASFTGRPHIEIGTQSTISSCFGWDFMTLTTKMFPIEHNATCNSIQKKVG